MKSYPLGLNIDYPIAALMNRLVGDPTASKTDDPNLTTGVFKDPRTGIDGYAIEAHIKYLYAKIEEANTELKKNIDTFTFLNQLEILASQFNVDQFQADQTPDPNQRYDVFFMGTPPRIALSNASTNGTQTSDRAQSFLDGDYDAMGSFPQSAKIVDPGFETTSSDLFEQLKNSGAGGAKSFTGNVADGKVYRVTLSALEIKNLSSQFSSLLDTSKQAQSDLLLKLASSNNDYEAMCNLISELIKTLKDAINTMARG